MEAAYRWQTDPTMSDLENANDEEKLDDVGRLIRFAGARESVSPERIERMRRNVHAHWQDVVRDQRRGRLGSGTWRFALAASLLLALGVSLVLPLMFESPAPLNMASVERVLGETSVAGRQTQVGAIIQPGQVIETAADGRIAVRLLGGQSLRLDHSTRLVAHTANHLALEAGAVYIDTVGPGLEPVLVATAFGDAQDIGTQFQVRLAPGLLVVGVREGRVEVSRAQQSLPVVDSGTFLELSAAGNGNRRAVSGDDPDWRWVETVAPEFEINGATLTEFLLWYTRERGIELRWADNASKSAADRATLIGSIKGLTLDQALDTVSRISSFEYRLEQNAMWVSVP